MKVRPPVPAEPERMPRLFVLQRVEDVHNHSGIGRVAWGCQFPNGKVVMEWQTRGKQVAVWDHIGDAIHHHGHGVKTKLVWLDSQPVVEQLDTAAAWARYEVFASVKDNTKDLRYLQAALHCMPDMPNLLRAYDALVTAHAQKVTEADALQQALDAIAESANSGAGEAAEPEGIGR